MVELLSEEQGVASSILARGTSAPRNGLNLSKDTLRSASLSANTFCGSSSVVERPALLCGISIVVVRYLAKVKAPVQLWYPAPNPF